MTRAARLLLAPLVALSLLGPALPASAQQAAPVQATWHAEQARVPEARAPGRDGEGVLVAVLDTWVDGAHPDFEGRVVAGADCTGGTCREDVVGDQCEHGTHVAGTVAASSYGVAPRAQVLPVKVLTYDAAANPPACNGSVAGVAAGIRYATARGARVINLSLGTLVPGLSSSSAISTAVAEAARAGAVVVFAAGNSSVPVADSYGGDALIVAATGPNGQLASYSQRGAGVSLAAPGGDPATLSSCSPTTCVTSLFPQGRYAVAAGTSMAAPHVAGIAALLIAQDPARSREQVLDRLRGTAQPLPGAGSGLVDATAALSNAPVRGAEPAPVAPAAAAPPQQPAPPAPGPAPAGTGSTEVPVGVLPGVEPLPSEVLLGEQPEVADPVPLETAAPPLATQRSPGLPPTPPAIAVSLLVAAALANLAVGRSRVVRSDRLR